MRSSLFIVSLLVLICMTTLVVASDNRPPLTHSTSQKFVRTISRSLSSSSSKNKIEKKEKEDTASVGLQGPQDRVPTWNVDSPPMKHPEVNFDAVPKVVKNAIIALSVQLGTGGTADFDKIIIVEIPKAKASYDLFVQAPSEGGLHLTVNNLLAILYHYIEDKTVKIKSKDQLSNQPSTDVILYHATTFVLYDSVLYGSDEAIWVQTVAKGIKNMEKNMEMNMNDETKNTFIALCHVIHVFLLKAKGDKVLQDKIGNLWAPVLFPSQVDKTHDLYGLLKRPILFKMLSEYGTCAFGLIKCG